MSDPRREMYEAKARYVARKNAANAEVSTLTEGQHEVLRYICGMRHEIHSDPYALFTSESSDNARFWDFMLGGDSDDTSDMSSMLNSVGLPRFTTPVSLYDYVTDQDDFDSDDERDEAIERVYSVASKFNKAVEEYLALVDEMYGTEYCPTGIARSRDVL